MLFNSLTHHPSLAKLSIDMDYNNNSVKALADMLSSNSTLQYLNLCSLLVFMRKTFAPKIFKGIEIPDSMKTDRGVPDMQSHSDNLVKSFHDVFPGLPGMLKRFRDTLPDTDPGKLAQTLLHFLFGPSPDSLATGPRNSHLLTHGMLCQFLHVFRSSNHSSRTIH